MLKSKVMDILKTFTPEELKSFRNYVISPYHNSNKNVIKLFELARKHSPDYDSASLKKESIFVKLYPGKKYSDIVMRILISDFLRLLEEFLAYQKYLSEPLAEKLYLLDELKRRGIDGLYAKHIKETDKFMLSEGNMHTRYFLDMYDIENERIDYLISKDRQDESGEYLLKKSEYLVMFFLTNILNTVNELGDIKEVLNQKFNFNPADELVNCLDLERIIDYFRKNDYKYTPVLEIYYYMHKSTQQEDSRKFFDKLKSSIINNLNIFRKDEQYNLFLILETCCLAQRRLGTKRENDELLEIYKLMLSNDILVSQRGYIQANLFRNIFYTAVMVNEYNWAEKFVNDYYHLLVPEQKSDMFNYTKAVINFEKGSFGEALEHVSKINYNFFVFKFDAKVLTLKLHYEMKSFEPALSLVDSFTHFLSKNKIVTEFNKESFMNFLKFFKILIKCSGSKINKQKFDLDEINIDLSKTKYVIGKKWLVEKIEELS